MYWALVQFFTNLFFDYPDTDDFMEGIWIIQTGQYSNGDNYTLTITTGDYLAHICAIISLILIIVLCCLFVYKIIKLIGGLIR